jgi:glyoxylase-like metal-dependent hydrolase (beta-lactamase superfamily II)
MKTLRFGASTVERIVEMDTLWFDPAAFYPEIAPDAIERHARALGPRLIDPVTKKIALSFHSYLIRTPRLNILVDTCNGNHKPRGPKVAWQDQLASNTYLENLACAGLRPEDIDLVLCTHLHTDHVGWNTCLRDGRWVPTFPKARYLMARQEFEHFARLHEAKPAYPVNHGSWEDSVLPVVATGQAELVDMTHRVTGDLDDGIWLEPACGHTPGHVTIHVKGGGRDAIMSGDIIHHAISLAEPDLAMYADYDPQMGRQTRRRLLERCADTSTLLLTGHFPAPTAGHVCSNGDAFTFRFLEE